MTVRDASQLRADGETPETIKSAIAELDEIAVPPAWTALARRLRNELLEELRNIEGRLL